MQQQVKNERVKAGDLSPLYSRRKRGRLEDFITSVNEEVSGGTIVPCFFDSSEKAPRSHTICMICISLSVCRSSRMEERRKAKTTFIYNQGLVVKATTDYRNIIGISVRVE